MPPIIPLGFDFKVDSKRTFKSKSTAFEAVEEALSAYCTVSNDTNLRLLTVALGDWKLAKRKGTATWTGSARADTVKLLSDWLIKESEARGIFPTSSSDWSGNHNCYAYAMLCLNPVAGGNNSWPGMYADIPNKGDFAKGVVDDAAAQGVTVQILRRDGLPTPVPNALGGGNYLVALLANQFGYHFMRRNEPIGLWTHKNGAPSPVETYFYDTTIEQPVAMTDAVVAQILANPVVIGCSMTFKAYLSVPVPGIKVKGRSQG